MFAGLLVGAMLPYWFSAMTMKSVGKAALAMVEEVRRQFSEIPGLMEGTARPDYRRCVEISTAVSPAGAQLAGDAVFGAVAALDGFRSALADYGAMWRTLTLVAGTHWFGGNKRAK